MIRPYQYTASKLIDRYDKDRLISVLYQVNFFEKYLKDNVKLSSWNTDVSFEQFITETKNRGAVLKTGFKILHKHIMSKKEMLILNLDKHWEVVKGIEGFIDRFAYITLPTSGEEKEFSFPVRKIVGYKQTTVKLKWDSNTESILIVK